MVGKGMGQKDSTLKKCGHLLNLDALLTFRPPVFDIPFRKGADAIASGSSIQSRATPQGPDYVDYGAYTGKFWLFVSNSVSRFTLRIF